MNRTSLSFAIHRELFVTVFSLLDTFINVASTKVVESVSDTSRSTAAYGKLDFTTEATTTNSMDIIRGTEAESSSEMNISSDSATNAVTSIAQHEQTMAEPRSHTETVSHENADTISSASEVRITTDTTMNATMEATTFEESQVPTIQTETTTNGPTTMPSLTSDSSKDHKASRLTVA